MSDYFKIVVDQKELDNLIKEYGKELPKKAIKTVSKYANIIARDSKEILEDYNYRDTGRLINSIKPSIRAYANKITGEVNVGTNYARFIHEGAKHTSDTNTERHFVPFSVAPGLYKWAKKNKVIKTIDGADRLASTGQVVYPNKGGLLVHIAPTKFFEKPYSEYKEKFIEEITTILD